MIFYGGKGAGSGGEGEDPTSNDETSISSRKWQSPREMSISPLMETSIHSCAKASILPFEEAPTAPPHWEHRAHELKVSVRGIVYMARYSRAA